MLTQKDINKNMLQLIGITSLFIASKLEVSSQTLSRDIFTPNIFLNQHINSRKYYYFNINSLGKMSGFFQYIFWTLWFGCKGKYSSLLVSKPIISLRFTFWNLYLGEMFHGSFCQTNYPIVVPIHVLMVPGFSRVVFENWSTNQIK